MTPEINEYLDDARKKMEVTDLMASQQQRTSDYTITKFSDSKRDRFWEMKTKGELVDGVLLTADGHKEVSVSIIVNFTKLTFCVHLVCSYGSHSGPQSGSTLLLDENIR